MTTAIGVPLHGVEGAAAVTRGLRARVDLLERTLIDVLARHSITFLRFGMGIVFLWFGALKFFPGLSPAEDVAARTVDALTLGLLPLQLRLVLLATLECAIGVGLLSGRLLRPTLLLLAFQMSGTLVPLVLFPAEVFGPGPYAPTMEGQYIIKNLVLIGAGAVIGATVRGGRIVPVPVQPGHHSDRQE